MDGAISVRSGVSIDRSWEWAIKVCRTVKSIKNGDADVSLFAKALELEHKRYLAFPKRFCLGLLRLCQPFSHVDFVPIQQCHPPLSNLLPLPKVSLPSFGTRSSIYNGHTAASIKWVLGSRSLLVDGLAVRKLASKLSQRRFELKRDAY